MFRHLYKRLCRDARADQRVDEHETSRLLQVLQQELLLLIFEHLGEVRVPTGTSPRGGAPIALLYVSASCTSVRQLVVGCLHVLKAAREDQLLARLHRTRAEVAQLRFADFSTLDLSPFACSCLVHWLRGGLMEKCCWLRLDNGDALPVAQLRGVRSLATWGMRPTRLRLRKASWGIMVIAGLIQSNAVLTSLDLSGASLDAEASKALAGALKVNGSLTSVGHAPEPVPHASQTRQ